MTLQIIFSVDVFLQVLSSSGKAEALTESHRPYGSSKASLQEIRRVREAGGWVCFHGPKIYQDFFRLSALWKF